MKMKDRRRSQPKREKKGKPQTEIGILEAALRVFGEKGFEATTISAICKENNGGLFYASNYSIGVNILFSLNEKLAAIMNQFPEFKPSITEVHHIHKADAPSGTAISLADGITSNHDGFTKWKLDEKGAEMGSKTLPIVAEREGEVFGFQQNYS